MSDKPNEEKDISAGSPEEIAAENEILKLKMMAELGAVFGPTSQDLPPEAEQQFLQQMYAFEKNYAAGAGVSFAETFGEFPFKPFDELDLMHINLETVIEQVEDFYKLHHFDVVFEFDYPAETRYRFLVEDLPNEINHFGTAPGMMVGVLYEEYYPNHGGSIETTTEDFMEALQELNAEKLKFSLSPLQILPEGPYPAQVMLDALEERFKQIASLNDFEYSILETSYDLSGGDPDEDDQLTGMGYTEGLVKFLVLDKSGEAKSISGPFKFYFQYEYGVWSIINMVFPGLKYPPLPEKYELPDEEA